MQPRPWRLCEAKLAQVRAADFQVAMLPFGATEPHNLHLPYGTDTYEAEGIADELCQAAHTNGAKIVLLPTIPYGTETNQREFPLSLNLNPSTLLTVLRDLTASLALTGIHKLVILNSHGGNDFKPMLRELYGTTPVQIFLINWYQAMADCAEQIFSQPDDHAGEMETSLIMALQPQLVARDAQGKLTADDGIVKATRFEAVNRGWVSITRPWHLLTTNSGAGNPHAATAEKGKQLLAAITERLAGFLVELSNSPVDRTFPF